MEKLLATNEQAKQQTATTATSTADAMRQTTLTQCFNPPVAVVPPAAIVPTPTSDYRMVEVDGQKYLLKDTTNHLVVVPAAAQPASAKKPRRISEKARSVRRVDLARDSYEESPSSVTPSVKKVLKKPGLKRPPTTGRNDFVLSESHESGSGDDDIVYVAAQKKRRKLAPLPLPSSDKSVSFFFA